MIPLPQMRRSFTDPDQHTSMTSITFFLLEITCLQVKASHTHTDSTHTYTPTHIHTQANLSAYVQMDAKHWNQKVLDFPPQPKTETFYYCTKTALHYTNAVSIHCITVKGYFMIA